jgi:hypothetical protein
VSALDYPYREPTIQTPARLKKRALYVWYAFAILLNVFAYVTVAAGMSVAIDCVCEGWLGIAACILFMTTEAALCVALTVHTRSVLRSVERYLTIVAQTKAPAGRPTGRWDGDHTMPAFIDFAEDCARESENEVKKCMRVQPPRCLRRTITLTMSEDARAALKKLAAGPPKEYMNRIVEELLLAAVRKQQ